MIGHSIQGNLRLSDLYHTLLSREVKDCLAFQESSMAINMLVMRVNQAQKVKETVNNLLLSIAPRVHRVRRGNTKENIQSCKFSF